jgi:flavin-dependent dehydrogenase/uncharacterized membrane protein
MQARRLMEVVPRLAAGAYPLLVFVVCRRGVVEADAWGLAILYVALSLPLALLAPWVAGALAGKRINLKIPIFVLLMLATGGAVWLFALQLRGHYQWFFLIQDSAFFVLLAYYFAASLRAGREPLCTFFARHVHHTLSPELLKYTRFLTKVWVLFFVSTGCISWLLFFFASNAVWAFYTNLLVPVLVVITFVVENACRRFVLPAADRVGLLGTYRALRTGGLAGAMRSSAPESETVLPMNTIAASVQEVPKTCDVLVIGGGPAGTTAASLLREIGYHVVLLEKCHHPRFHIGESLLPANLPLFEKLGVAKQVEALGMPKLAAEFVSPWHDHQQEFRFADGWNKSLPSAYQVERSKFDFVLIKNARDKGVEVLEGCEVQSVDLYRSDGMAEVRARTDAGQSMVWHTRFVADASGRSTFLSSKLQLKERSKDHNSVAIYAHFVGAERRQGAAEGNISLFWFDHGWFWYIPLRGGATSVGMVTWPYFVKTRCERSLSDFFKDGIASCAPLSARLKDAHMAIDVTATGNFSYSSRRAYGKNYLLLGDAFAFVDPMFSSGVWLAMNSGDQGAKTIEICLKQPAKAAAALRAFDRMMRKGPREYSWFIHRITHPTLRDMFMCPSEKLRMKEALLSLLAGDIFGTTPIWRSIALFKSAYYLVSVKELGRTYVAWRRRHFDIRRDQAVEASVTSV